LTFQGAQFHLNKLSIDPNLASLVLDARLDHAHRPDLPWAIAMLLSFLMGANVRLVARETYDASGQLIEEEWYPSRGPAAQPQYEPINWTHSGSETMELNWQLPEILSNWLERYSALKDEIDLPAIIGSLVAANGMTIEVTSFLRVMAMKKMSEAHAALKQKKEPRPRLVDFIRDLGISLSKEERAIVMDAVKSAESGAFLSTAGSPEEIRRRHAAMGTLIKISNACLLQFLGYDGPVIDYGRVGFPTVSYRSETSAW
jgi:hypothetical protein